MAFNQSEITMLTILSLLHFVRVWFFLQKIAQCKIILVKRNFHFIILIVIVQWTKKTQQIKLVYQNSYFLYFLQNKFK